MGVPGNIGGAATKIAHLIRLLHGHFQITVVVSEVYFCKDKSIKRFLEPFGIPCVLLKDLPKKLEGVALAICELHFFSSGKARAARERGLKLVWSNEMMWAFKGEPEAAREGLIDRVLY